MTIRKAVAADMARIGELLYQVHDVHADLHPDLYKKGGRKYSDEEIAALIADEGKVVFVYEDEARMVQAYAICFFQTTSGLPSLHERKVLFIDDLCVDASQRGKKIGEKLYRYVVDFARSSGCNSLTLYVANANGGALGFYEKLGMEPLKTLMEQRF